MARLPNPGDVFSAIDKAGSVIDKGLDFIDKVSGKLDKLGLTESTIQDTKGTPEIQPQRRTAGSGVTTEETIAYQKREIGKLLLRMETHYAQRLRINGIPCDCGAQKHLLDLESLCEETIPMGDNPQVYYSIIEWIKKIGPKSTDKAAKSGLYDKEYPSFSHEARDFRKDIVGSIEPKTLFPQKPGEPGEEEREQISLDKAKKMAAEEAAKEVERQWKG